MSPEKITLIIGAGVFGASTAYHLSQQFSNPSNITIIDKTPPSPESSAASTDINKIIRADYSSPFYAALAYEAMQAWAEWPDLKPYFHRTGWIMLDAQDSDLADRIRKVFQETRGHDPTENVSIEDIEKRWKGILKGTDLTKVGKAYWNPEAGWCEASAATARIVNAAIGRGVRYEVGDVEKLLLRGGKIQGVRTRDGREFYADRVVLATGAWTSSLLSPLEDELQLAEADRVERQASAAGVSVVHYKMSVSEMGRLSDMPVVVYGEHGEVIPPPRENCLLKFTNSKTFRNTIATGSGHKISVPSQRDQYSVPEALRKEAYKSMSSKVMPTFTEGKAPEYWRLCWDAYTPTQDWLLSRHPDSRLSNLYFAVGGSFHSYKFLPTIGKYMANILSGEGNGAEKDRAWGWKDANFKQRGAHEATAPKRELRDVEEVADYRLPSKL